MQRSYEFWVKSASVAALCVVSLLITAKLVAWWYTGSVSMLASVTDSLLDLMASGVNFFIIRFALHPPDKEHRFGHGKAEPLAGLIMAAFILGSSLLLVFHALSNLMIAKPVAHSELGYGVSLLAILLTLALVSFQHYVIGRTGSMAIKADSLHYKGDLLLNGGVLLAIFFSQQGVVWADPVIAILIAAYMATNAWGIGRSALDQLIDRELPESQQQQILALAQQHPKVLEVHGFRSRQAGKQMFIQMHLVLPDDFSLLQAHDVADQVEASIIAEFAQADVLIHMDPLRETNGRVKTKSVATD